MTNAIPYDPKAIANWFIERAKSEGSSLDPMKLQKLVYFSHGWHLGLRGCALINEEVEAWTYGPVLPSLYHEFKQYGSGQVADLATDLEVVGNKLVVVTPRVPEADSDTRALLARIWEVYGHLSGSKLSAMTHDPNAPWTKIRQKYGAKRGAGIPDDDIRAYFAERVERASA